MRQLRLCVHGKKSLYEREFLARLTRLPCIHSVACDVVTLKSIQQWSYETGTSTLTDGHAMY